MTDSVIETKYPLSFRKDDAKNLGEHLKLRHSVELVGLKRVGISDFLRFFLYRRGVVEKYIERGEFHLFIAVDLNDLVEREVFPFWILTFKRLADSIEKFNVDLKLKKEIGALFLSAIQSQDLFLTVEYLRESLVKISKAGIIPTIFFIRFDRIAEILDNEVFSVLESLIDASGQKLAYVFTSYRTIDEVVEKELDRNFLHVFANICNLKPANFKDTRTIFDTLKKRYHLKVKGNVERKLIEVSGGHVQYLHLCILVLMQKKGADIDFNDLTKTVLSDERIRLQSEEIWESLTDPERDMLLKVHQEQTIKTGEKGWAKYLWDTGLVLAGRDKPYIFSPLFENYLDNKNEEEATVELTKKENALFNLLLSEIDKVCEREKIIETVWPESEELGVSDWTIDRLVSRLRDKLKKQKSNYSIITVKTRGFKLTKQ